MNLICSIWILGATIGVITFLILFFQRTQQKELDKKLRGFLNELNQMQRYFLERFTSEQRLFEAERFEKIKEWLLREDNLENEK